MSDMIFYQLNKEEYEGDSDGRNLYNYIHNNLTNVEYIKIEDISAANNGYYLTNCSRMFYNLRSNLKTVDLSELNLSNVTDMNLMFGYCNNIQNIELPEMYNITNMQSAFLMDNMLTDIPTNLNTSKVTQMCSSFEGCNRLKNINIDTSNVTNFSQTFKECHSISNFLFINITNKATNCYSTFVRCYNLTTEQLMNMNIDTSNVTDMSSLFWQCNNSNFYTIPNLNTTKVTKMSAMFSYDYYLINIPNNLYTANAINIYTMFTNCCNLSYIYNYNFINVKNAYNFCSGCNSLTSIPSFNLPNCNDARGFIENCINLTAINNLKLFNLNWGANFAKNCTNLITINNLNIYNALNLSMTNGFSNCSNLTTVNNLIMGNNAYLINWSYAFYNDYCLNNIKYFSMEHFSTASANLSYMFYNCTNLGNTTATYFNNVNINGYSIPQEGLNNTFYNCINMKIMPNFINLNSNLDVKYSPNLNKNCLYDIINKQRNVSTSTPNSRTITINNNLQSSWSSTYTTKATNNGFTIAWY